MFGAVIARRDGTILAHGGNRVITKNDSTKHVELEVIQYAVGTQTSRYLPDVTLYSTCELCSMCASAAYWAGIKRIVWAMTQLDLAAYGEKFGNGAHRYRPSPTKIEWSQWAREFGIETGQLLGAECVALLQGKKIKL